jgi:uncharacterized membrane protein YfcA
MTRKAAMPRSTLLTIPIALALAALRLLGHKDAAFQAAAHLFVGGLVGAWLSARPAPRARWYFGLAIALSLVELAAFLASRR